MFKMAMVISFPTKTPITEFTFKENFLVVMEGTVSKEVLLVFDPLSTN